MLNLFETLLGDLLESSRELVVDFLNMSIVEPVLRQQGAEIEVMTIPDQSTGAEPPANATLVS